jgi:hypothetical protein
VKRLLLALALAAIAAEAAYVALRVYRDADDQDEEFRW